jgi:hypothetical protein
LLQGLASPISLFHAAHIFLLGMAPTSPSLSDCVDEEIVPLFYFPRGLANGGVVENIGAFPSSGSLAAMGIGALLSLSGRRHGGRRRWGLSPSRGGWHLPAR